MKNEKFNVNKKNPNNHTTEMKNQLTISLEKVKYPIKSLGYVMNTLNNFHGLGLNWIRHKGPALGQRGMRVGVTEMQAHIIHISNVIYDKPLFL